MMIWEICPPTRFLQVEGGCFGPTKRVHSSHDGRVGYLIGCRLEYGQPINRNHVVRLDRNGV